MVESVAVTADDVVSALEARRQRGQSVVLRMTPPFSARMRARIHVGDDSDDGETPAPIHIDPNGLVTDDAPTYPTPAETEDALRDDPDAEYTVERHRERHEAAVAQWRDRVREHFADAVAVETPEDTLDVDVAVLG